MAKFSLQKFIVNGKVTINRRTRTGKNLVVEEILSETPCFVALPVTVPQGGADFIPLSGGVDSASYPTNQILFTPSSDDDPIELKLNDECVVTDSDNQLDGTYKVLGRALPISIPGNVAYTMLSVYVEKLNTKT